VAEFQIGEAAERRGLVESGFAKDQFQPALKRR
jgi:hypothetical protein